MYRDLGSGDADGYDQVVIFPLGESARNLKRSDITRRMRRDRMTTPLPRFCDVIAITGGSLSHN